MKSSRSLLLILFTVMILISFLSVPVFSGGGATGDEDPWGADNSDPNNSAGTPNDSIVSQTGFVVTGGNLNPGDVTFEGLVFSISYDLVYYLFGYTIQPSNTSLNSRDFSDRNVRTHSSTNNSDAK